MINRSVFFLCIILTVCIIAGTIKKAFSEEPPPNEYEVKAAFLYNIAMFVEWPAASRGNPSAHLNLCVLGNDPFGTAIKTIDGMKLRDNMTIVLMHVASIRNLGNCHILFIPSAEKERVEQIVETVGRSHVLTVGDTAGFAQKGVTVNFYLEHKKVRFEINMDAVRRAGLKISSQLLKLAKIIDD
jgi:hypothetical protein